MDVENYISSGVLELYLTGTLNEEENWEVHQNALQHPKIKEEILSIEAALFELSKSIFPEILRKKGFDDLINRIDSEESVQPVKKRISKYIYIGAGATFLLTFGLLWPSYKISQLTSEVSQINQQNQVLEIEINETKRSLAKSKEILKIVSNKNTITLSLVSQKDYFESNAVIYWNKEEEKVYLNAQGLTKPPDGFEYQIWTLNLDSSNVTSIGILENLFENKEKIFELKNPLVSEVGAFGITLEPKGGSPSTTMEQMLMLNTVSK